MKGCARRCRIGTHTTVTVCVCLLALACAPAANAMWKSAPAKTAHEQLDAGSNAKTGPAMLTNISIKPDPTTPQGGSGQSNDLDGSKSSANPPTAPPTVRMKTEGGPSRADPSLAQIRDIVPLSSRNDNEKLSLTGSMRLPSSMDEFAASMIGMFVIKFMTGIDDILWLTAYISTPDADTNYWNGIKYMLSLPLLCLFAWVIAAGFFARIQYAFGDGYWTFTHVAALTCGLGFVMYGCWLVYVEEYMGRGRSRAVAGHLSTGRDPFHDAKTVSVTEGYYDDGPSSQALVPDDPAQDPQSPVVTRGGIGKFLLYGLTDDILVFVPLLATTNATPADFLFGVVIGGAFLLGLAKLLAGIEWYVKILNKIRTSFLTIVIGFWVLLVGLSQ